MAFPTPLRGLFIPNLLTHGLRRGLYFSATTRLELLGGGFFFGSLAQCGHGGGGVIFSVFVFGAAFSFGGVVILRHRTSLSIGGWGRLPEFAFEEVAVKHRGLHGQYILTFPNAVRDSVRRRGYRQESLP